MVLQGRVRELHRIGNDHADLATDSDRRRVDAAVTDARRHPFTCMQALVLPGL